MLAIGFTRTGVGASTGIAILPNSLFAFRVVRASPGIAILPNGGFSFRGRTFMSDINSPQTDQLRRVPQVPVFGTWVLGLPCLPTTPQSSRPLPRRHPERSEGPLFLFRQGTTSVVPSRAPQTLSIPGDFNRLQCFFPLPSPPSSPFPAPRRPTNAVIQSAVREAMNPSSSLRGRACMSYLPSSHFPAPLQ